MWHSKIKKLCGFNSLKKFLIFSCNLTAFSLVLNHLYHSQLSFLPNQQVPWCTVSCAVPKQLSKIYLNQVVHVKPTKECSSTSSYYECSLLMQIASMDFLPKVSHSILLNKVCPGGEMSVLALLQFHVHPNSVGLVRTELMPWRIGVVMKQNKYLITF